MNSIKPGYDFATKESACFITFNRRIFSLSLSSESNFNMFLIYIYVNVIILYALQPFISAASIQLSYMRVIDHLGSHSQEKWRRMNPYGGHTNRHPRWGMVHAGRWVGILLSFHDLLLQLIGKWPAVLKMLRVIVEMHDSWCCYCTRPCACCFPVFLLNLLQTSDPLYEITLRLIF